MRFFALTRAAGAVAAFAALTLAAFAAPASAHTALSGSSPADGAKVDSVTEVVLTFNEEVRSGQLVIQDQDEKPVHKGKVTISGTDVERKVREALPAGKYTVGYRVISADGHPVTGSLSFTVTGTAATAPASPGAVPETASPSASPEGGSGSGTARWLMVGVGLAAGAGVGLLISMRRRRNA
ncbi:copper resistance protein CopC [Actinocorallia aurea]